MKLSGTLRLAVSVVLLLAVIAPADAATLCTPFGCLYMPDLFASRRDRVAECERKQEAAIRVCNGMILPISRALCYDRANQAYGRCLNAARKGK